MLHVIQIKKEHHALGLKVSVLVNSLKECDLLTTFDSNFKQELKKIRTGNNIQADHQYRTRLEHQWTPNEKLLVVRYHQSKVEQIIFVITK